MLQSRTSSTRAPRTVLLVLTVLILFGSLGRTEATVYYSLTKESLTTVSSPSVILQNGTVGTSTIYTNSTSAKVSVSGYGYYFVDNNDSNVDPIPDKGTHSNFTAQQYGPDSINDTLTEKNTEPNSEYVWVSGDDDIVRKLNKSDLSGPEILSWDTGTSYPYGCEHRIEDGNEYIYILDPGATVDALIKFHANNGTEVTRWDISGYSGDAWGLAWNGSRWFISDKNDDLIYQVDPADPTVQERSFTYTGIGITAGLAWDGSYLWTVDFENHYAYQLDVQGNIQTSWSMAANLTQPTGIAYDTTSGHLWIVSKATDHLYEYYINGTAINDWDPFPGSIPEGVAYASVEETYNYELDLEVQWTSVDFDETYEELCVKTGTFSGSEDIMVYAWNVSTSDWHFLYNLTASSWNNVSITDWLNNENFTVRFLGGTESGDTDQDSWNIDATLLHIWTVETYDYDYVLRVNNTVTDSWEIRLKKYSDFNIDRLQNCTIYFHNSTDGTSAQIEIEEGNYKPGGDEGSWYNLPSSETIYMAMTAQANSTATSYVSAYLEIRIPDTTTFAQYIITFEIT